jgi:hypothetical protein
MVRTGPVANDYQWDPVGQTPPGLEKDLVSLLSRKTTHKERILAADGTRPRVSSEVRLYHELFGREAPGDELLSGELGESDKQIHGSPPSSDGAVNRQQGGNRRAGRPTLTIAGVANTRDRNCTRQAVLADVTIPEQEGARAEQSVVVQRLHDWYPDRPRGVIDRRRDEREGVVHMHDARALLLEEAH